MYVISAKYLFTNRLPSQLLNSDLKVDAKYLNVCIYILDAFTCDHFSRDPKPSLKALFAVRHFGGDWPTVRIHTYMCDITF